MEGPQSVHHLPQARIRLVGTIAGFMPDGARVAAALEAEPEATCVALGVPPEDIAFLDELLQRPEAAADLPELDEWTAKLFEHLAAWGEARVPSPDLAAAHHQARRRGIQVEPLDLDDDAHTDAHTRRLKVRHLVRMNRIRNRMLKEPFAADDPYALARSWDAREHGIEPLRQIQREREGHMAARLRELAERHRIIVAVVPAARHAGIAAHLGTPEPARLNA